MSTFPETNLRTYVRGPDGRDGIWFFSLEADSLPLVLGARTLYGVPYRWADMSVERTGDVIRYRSRRRLGPPAEPRHPRAGRRRRSTTRPSSTTG